MQLEELSNISDNLAMMPDPALQKFAQMHKQDPYMVSLALSESNRRKKMRMAAQGQAGAMPQPKVVDAAIQGMRPAPAPMMAQTRLPEDQGIAQIPAPNMQAMADGGIAGYGDGDDVPRQNGMAQGGMYDFAQRSEPVIRMSGGGVPGYAKGDRVIDYRQAIIDEAQMQGVPAAVALQISGVESNFDPKARPIDPKTGKPRSSATSFFQVIDETFKNLGGDPKKRNDPMENIRVGVKSLAQNQAALTKTLGRPPKPQELYTTHFLGTDTGSKLLSADPNTPISAFLDKTDPKNKEKILTANPEVLGGKKTVGDVLAWTQKKMAPVLTSAIPIGTAQAVEPPKAQAAAPADTSLAAQIPGQAMQAPASNYDQTNSFFGRMADKLGIPLEAQRQIGTTLNAPTPLAPVVGSTKAGSSGIAALGEKLADKLGLLKGPPGSMSKADIAALQKESSGLKALEATQQATKEAQAAGATLEEQEYLRKMMEANRASQVPSKASQIAEASLLREGQDVATAQRLAQTGERAQAAGRAESLANTVLPPDSAAPAANTAAGKIPFKGIDDAELQRMQEANQAPMTKDDIVKAAEEVTPVKERKGFSNDDLLTLGLSLLASKSPNFMTALGEAGLATVAGKKEREKIEREQAKSGVELDYMKARTKEAEANAALIERGGREKKLELEAEKMIQKHMADWMDSMEGKTGALRQDGGLAKQREEERVRTAIYASLGITPIMRSTSASSGVGLSASDSALINKYLR
jgi:hypothetical protein